MRKTGYTTIPFILSTLLLVGCSSGSNETITETTPETTVETTSETVIEEVTETLTEIVTETVSETTAPVSKYFTSYLAGPLSMECLTCEGEKGVWAHLINPFNDLALFEPIGEGELDADTSNLVICFNVSGVSDEITAFCGISASSVSGKTVSVWDNNGFNAITGENFEFVISEDDYYEMIIPLSKLGDGTEGWDGLGHLEVLEIAFYGAERTLESGGYAEELTEGLEFEFLGIKAE